MKNKRGQIGNILAVTLGLVIGVILLVGVLVPLTVQTVRDAGNTTAYLGTSYNTTSYWQTSFTGVTATIGNNLTTFILIGVLVLIAGVALLGMSRR